MAAGSSATQSLQLDVVFDGTWIFVPSANQAGVITSVDVYSPACGHPHGALFLNQLGPFTPQNWPALSAFYMLDNHGLTLAIGRSGPAGPGITSNDIDSKANHRVPKVRPTGGNWDLAISITAGPDAWASTGTIAPQTTDSSGKTVPCFSGNDAPTANVSSIQTLSFKGVSSVALCGAPSTLQSFLPTPFAASGSLLFEGEVPYIPTLQHERATITAMANLAGLDLALEHPLPSSGSASPGPVMKPRVGGAGNCGHAIIIGPR
jgi:hypothetical protein